MTTRYPGAANFHDIPEPRYAGFNAPVWALLAGETQHDVTWHAIIDRIDEGDIYVQSTFDEDETTLILNTKCFEAGIATFAELIEQIEVGAAQRRAQALGDRNVLCQARSSGCRHHAGLHAHDRRNRSSRARSEFWTR